MSPHRSNISGRWPVARPGRDGDLLLALGLFWVVSVVRVVGGLLRHEAFAAEATLALMAVLGLPWLLVRRPR